MSELTIAQTERANRALELWFQNPGGDTYCAPGAEQRSDAERQNMHAALTADTLDDAMLAFGLTGDPALVAPEQYRQNRADMAALREQFRHPSERP